MSSSLSSSSSHTPWITFFFAAVLSSLSSIAIGCAPREACPAVTTAAAPRPRAHEHLVYRFDFAVTSTDSTGGAPTTSLFTLNMLEGDKGEVHVGKNVALSPSPPPAGGPSAGGPRQDVGLKVAAHFRVIGEDPLLDVSLEMSAFEPPSTIRKIVAKSDTLAFAGKPVLVTSLEEDHKRYQLTVTATRVR